MKSWDTEYNLIREMQRPYIVESLEFMIRKKKAFASCKHIMEHSPIGDLQSLINRMDDEGRVITEAQGKGLMRKISDALLFLHGNNNRGRKIAHRDVKPENILLFQNPYTGEIYPKLCDLGIAKKWEFEDQLSTDAVIGTKTKI